MAKEKSKTVITDFTSIELFEDLIRFGSAMDNIEWEDMEAVDFVAVLIESDLNIDLATRFLEGILRVKFKVWSGKPSTPKALMAFSKERVLIKKRVSKYFSDIIALDYKISLYFKHERSIKSVILNRHIYRAKAPQQIPISLDNQKRIKEIKQSASYESVLLDIGRMREILFEEIIGVRVDIFDDELDDFGNPVIRTTLMERKLEGIPMYFKLLEELKTHMYSTSNERATPSDYLENQKQLDKRIADEKRRMIARKELIVKE